MARKRPDGADASAYESHREGSALRDRQRSEAGREIGSIPDIASVKRRARCRKSLRLFCETYNPEAFNLAWSPDHLRVIARIEEAATAGALFAFAMPRGSGKSSICRMAALWAISYGLRRYVFLIGANADKAADALAALKVFMRFLPDYAADFPEISHPASRIGGIAQRAGGQTCGGAPTLMEWAKDRVGLPSVGPPDNWPASWKLRHDGLVPTAGAVISASGLTGEGLRGSLLTLTTGEMVRPDLVLLDDPQTAESSRSPAQNVTRMKLVSADVLGMAGPGRSIAAVMPCTVIEQGDMIDEVLDRTRHPLWRGERTKLLTTMPINMAAWDNYFEVYSKCRQMEPPDLAPANVHYLAHRARLDEGALASWPARKGPDEVSAIQHAMHLYFRDPNAFFAEYQNDPQPQNADAARALQPDEVLARACNLPRGVVPRDATRLTAFIDVGAHVLWYAVCAWDERFGGCLIDAGCYPDQGRSYFTAADLRPALEDMPEFRGQPQDAAIYGGLEALAARVLGSEYRQEGTSAVLKVERALVDANWGPGTDLVYEFVRRSPYAGLLFPSHGKFIGASTNPMAVWPTKPGERKGWGWRLPPPSQGRGRHVVFDSNQWKTFLAGRLRTPPGAPGCLRLFSPGPGGHRLLADHLCAEYPVEVTGRGRKVEEWKELVGRDNHWFDCCVGACVAASVAGLVWTAAVAQGEAAGHPQPAQRPQQKLSEIRRRAREGC